MTILRDAGTNEALRLYFAIIYLLLRAITTRRNIFNCRVIDIVSLRSPQLRCNLIHLHEVNNNRILLFIVVYTHRRY